VEVIERVQKRKTIIMAQRLITKSERLLILGDRPVSIGDVLPDSTKVLFLDAAGGIYTTAPEGKPVRKADDGDDGFIAEWLESNPQPRGEMTVENVAKKVKEFDVNGNEQQLSSVAAALHGMNGKGTSESPETMYSPARFPTKPVSSAADGHATDAMPKGDQYLCEEEVQPGEVMRRVGPNFVMSPIDPGIAEPLNFQAPKPGPLPVKKEERGSLFRNLVDRSSTGSEDQLFGR
jgi:hypothetical protein